MESNNNKTNNNITSVNRAEYNVQCETVHYSCEPPPPYDSNPVAPVVTGQPVVHTLVQPTLRTNPTCYTCHICNVTVLTKVERTSTRKTHMLAGFICGFTLWCMLCALGAIPYFVPALQNTKHYCPNCNTLLGSYSKI